MNEPKPTGELGDPPKSLKADEKEAWFELASLIPPGVAANTDRWHVEETVCLMALSRRLRAVGQRMTAAEGSQLISNLGKMGMNPADRSRVTARLSDSAGRGGERQQPTPANAWDRVLSPKPQ